MLDQEELLDTAAAFGVGEAQVLRDHLISHLLRALGVLDLPVTFFGGTALARTHLADADHGARLSEDVDLYGPDRRATCRVLEERIPELLRRDFPRARWEPGPTTVRGSDAAVLVTDAGRVRIQVLDSATDHHELARFPAERRPVELRYHDLPASVDLTVPTMRSFAAMKTVAWLDRRAARDLYDLAGLARLGALSAATADLVRTVSGLRVMPHGIDRRPADDWATQLSHQTRTVPPFADCLAEVHQAYGESLGWNGG